MRLLIVDDDPLAALSLQTILSAKGFDVIATGHSGEEAIDLYDQLQPDLLLMDIRMDGINGLEAARRILSRHSDAKILFLTTFSDDGYIKEAISLGAMGYILKQNYENLPETLRLAASGQVIYGEGVAQKLPGLLAEQMKLGKQSAQADLLTRREAEIMALVADGKSNKEIASLLYLSEGRVRNAVSDILLKLSLRDRTQLAVYYHTHVKEDRG
ncbi:MAG: response regulator transcription factor [Clostridiales bacterium]|nr:response regulator transcription factor [Clostridiales bacterium]